MKPLKVLYLEAFYGGSHRNFADNLIAHSKHEYTLYYLPERNWKWRVRCGALHFLETVNHPEDYDLLFLPGMISLADLKAGWGSSCPPSLVYLHETQLSYPLPPGKSEDYLPYFTELGNCIHSDTLVFNSRFHRDSYLKALENLMARIPEATPRSFLPLIQRKSRIIYPGIHISDQPESARILSSGNHKNLNPITPKKKESPLILWNHRWDYDKDPEAFFRVIRKINPEEHPFGLVLLGENAQFTPKVFDYARERYGSRIVQFGWAESREDYINWLKQADIVISTALQENFGISMAEAAALGCFPLLPDRLVYPELVPESLKELILYKDEKDLKQKLVSLLKTPPAQEKITAIKEHYRQHGWTLRYQEVDRLIDETVGRQRASG